MKKLYVEGMHCPSCEVYMERKIKEISDIENVKTNFKDQTLEIDSDIDIDQMIEKTNKEIVKDGYEIQREPVKKEIDVKELVTALIISSTLFLIFILSQKMGIFRDINLTEPTLGTAFMIGIIASVSSCMAVVGSLVITISTIYKNRSSLVIFHIARIGAFFILGALLGLIGSSLTLSPSFYQISGIILFAVMMILGLNLLDIFPFMKNLEPRLPKSLTSGTLGRTSSPIILGILTFFLPCGFTQSTQIMAITSADALQGSLIMLVFSLGTLPVLALISFGLSSLIQGKYSSLFQKASGFLIILFAMYNLVALLRSAGLILVF